MSRLNRRKFLRRATAAAAVTGGAGLVAGCAAGPRNGGAPAVVSGKTYAWKMVTTWPPNFPILGESASLVARWVEEMSAGRLKIHVYGGGELIPPFEGFDAVSQGVAEMCHGASYYWAGKSPATQFFASIPFGMNAQQMHAWLYCGGGLELWEELYAQFGLVPLPVGNSGMQMGGWFNREIRTVQDLKGLKMRIPGLGGKVIAKAGGSAVLSAGGEIYTNLERGVIDATEWIGPYHDRIMGLDRAARFYYYPGWHEPNAVLELMVHKPAFDALPADLQAIVRSAAARSNLWVLSEFEAKNAVALAELEAEGKVELRRFPDDVLQKLHEWSDEVIREVVDADPMSKRAFEAADAFRKQMRGWAEITETVYYCGGLSS